MNQTNAFCVDLDVYQGPFDVLLSLLANHRLELTEISLGSITDEFIEFVRDLELIHNMEQVSSFIDVAAILVEAKSAVLLPNHDGITADEQSLEALRERDLLFARLLQYKAFKEAAQRFGVEITAQEASYAHHGCVDMSTQQMLPYLDWSTSCDELAQIAVRVLTNAPIDEVSVGQLHVPLVDIRQQTLIVKQRLMQAEGQSVAFEEIIEDASSSIEVAGRFLVVLILFRQQNLQYKQDEPFAPLYLRWIPARQDENELSVNQGDVE